MSGYSVTIELTELELALLYHTVTQDRGEHRPVFWEEGGRRERRFVQRAWLENKVFGEIARTQPEWLPVIEEARKRLTLRHD